ncbi:MAG: hypothetical protein ACYS8Y_13465 [Planctomycetota bacterium]
MTNDVTWWFHLPLNEGSWEQRRFYTIDILEQDFNDITDRLVEFLSKARTDSGQGIESEDQKMVYFSTDKDFLKEPK